MFTALAVKRFGFVKQNRQPAAPRDGLLMNVRTPHALVVRSRSESLGFFFENEDDRAGYVLATVSK